MKLELAHYVKVGIQNQILYIGFGSIQFSVSQSELQKEYLLVLSEWLNPHSEEEIQNKFHFLKNIKSIISELKKHNTLIPSGLYERSDRYSRQALYLQLSGLDAKITQKKLSNKKVAIVGCGGIGNLISVNLATAGVGHLHLLDSDTIEVSNLSRQIMFTENHIGLDKVETLKDAILERNSNTKVSMQSQAIQFEKDLEQLRDYDLVVLSADSYGVINLVNKFCVQEKIPYLNVCYVNDISVWGPFYIPGETGCMECQNIVSNEGTDTEIKNIIKSINKKYQAPSVGPINMLSSSLASIDILKFLAGDMRLKSLNKRVGLWTHDMHFEEQDCSKSENCQVCGELQ